jgi:hypothetical protein
MVEVRGANGSTDGHLELQGRNFKDALELLMYA